MCKSFTYPGKDKEVIKLVEVIDFRLRELKRTDKLSFDVPLKEVVITH